MNKLEELEAKVESIYNILSCADDLLDMHTALSQEQRDKYLNAVKELELKIDKTYKGMLNKLASENKEIADNELVKKIYDKNNKTNYLILSFLIKHPEIVSSTLALEQFEYFIYDSKNRYCRHSSFAEVETKLEELDDLSPKFFHNEIFIKFLNDYRFAQLDEYFKNETIMNNEKFVEYLSNKVLNAKEELEYGEYHNVSSIMETALSDGVDFDLVYALGNENKYKEYLSRYDKTFFLNLINSIQNQGLKKKMLADIFDIKDISKLPILLKFIEYPEIQKQLQDKDSFYYNVLIKPLIDYEELSSEIVEDKSEEHINEDYGSVRDIVEFNLDSFYDYDFNGMIHHFDKHVDNYIYFYSEGEIKKVPVLFYIKTMKRKTDLWIKLNSLDSYVDEDEDLFNMYFNLFNNYINKDLVELAVESLEENIGSKLSSKEEDCWTRLLEYAKNMSDQEKSINDIPVFQKINKIC